MPTYPKGSVNWAKQRYAILLPKYAECSTSPDMDYALHIKLTNQCAECEEIMEDPNAPMGDPIYSKEELERDFGQMVIE